MLMSEIAEIVMWVLIWLAAGLATALILLKEIRSTSIKRVEDSWVPDNDRLVKLTCLTVFAWPYFLASWVLAVAFGVA